MCDRPVADHSQHTLRHKSHPVPPRRAFYKIVRSAQRIIPEDSNLRIFSTRILSVRARPKIPSTLTPRPRLSFDNSAQNYHLNRWCRELLLFMPRLYSSTSRRRVVPYIAEIITCRPKNASQPALTLKSLGVLYMAQIILWNYQQRNQTLQLLFSKSTNLLGFQTGSGARCLTQYR